MGINTDCMPIVAASQPNASWKKPRREVTLSGAESFISGGNEFDTFHGDGASGAANGAQAATDAPGFVFDDRTLLAALRHAPVAGQVSGL